MSSTKVEKLATDLAVAIEESHKYNKAYVGNSSWEESLDTMFPKESSDILKSNLLDLLFKCASEGNIKIIPNNIYFNGGRMKLSTRDSTVCVLTDDHTVASYKLEWFQTTAIIMGCANKAANGAANAYALKGHKVNEEK